MPTKYPNKQVIPDTKLHRIASGTVKPDLNKTAKSPSSCGNSSARIARVICQPLTSALLVSPG